VPNSADTFKENRIQEQGSVVLSIITHGKRLELCHKAYNPIQENLKHDYSNLTAYTKEDGYFEH